MKMHPKSAAVVTIEALEGRTLLSAAAGSLFLPAAPRVQPAGEVLPTTFTVLPEQPAAPKATGTGDYAGAVVGDNSYHIDFDFSPSTTAAQRQVFNQAASIWESVLLGDVPDYNVGGSTGVVDDVRISADVTDIDGPGGILGRAGPTLLRPSGQNDLPVTGVMQFDAADVNNLAAGGGLLPVILHEMGHVLGIGTIWTNRGLLTGNGGSTPRFTGAAASGEYDRLSKAAETSVDVESTGGPGTRYSHWRESTYGSELMTGYLSGGAELSRITAASMIDLGYPNVNVDAAALYTLPGGNASRDLLPTVGSLTAGAASQTSGLTLTANNVADADGGVSLVRFYRESNGIAGLQAGTNTPDTLVASDTSAAGGWAATLAPSTLPVGDSTYYARANDTDGAYSAFRSVASNYSPDLIAPTVVSTAFDFDTRQAVVFNFSEPVKNVSASSVSVVNLTTGQTLPGGSFALAADSTSTRAAFRYTGGVLADGNYVATVSTGVTDNVGNPLGGNRTQSFFFLNADANRSRQVELGDFSILRSNFGIRSGATFSQGDFNYDGAVNLTDFSILRSAFGTRLPPPANLTASLFGDRPITGGGSVDADGPLV